jgi:hypothetical protein
MIKVILAYCLLGLFAAIVISVSKFPLYLNLAFLLVIHAAMYVLIIRKMDEEIAKEQLDKTTNFH